jgi:hypothetical protein
MSRHAVCCLFVFFTFINSTSDLLEARPNHSQYQEIDQYINMSYEQPFPGQLHLRGGGKDDEEVNTWGDLEQELAWLDSKFDAIEKEKREKTHQQKTKEEEIQGPQQ